MGSRAPGCRAHHTVCAGLRQCAHELLHLPPAGQGVPGWGKASGTGGRPSQAARAVGLDERADAGVGGLFALPAVLVPPVERWACLAVAGAGGNEALHLAPRATPCYSRRIGGGYAGRSPAGMAVVRERSLRTEDGWPALPAVASPGLP